MSIPQSNRYYFQPLLLDVHLIKIASCYYNYYDTYAALVDKYDMADVMDEQPNISPDIINAYTGSGPDDPLWCPPGFVQGPLHGDPYWSVDYYLLSSPPPDPDVQQYQIFEAMMWGLATWQFYRLQLRMQLLRFTKFGYYGRPPSDH